MVAVVATAVRRGVGDCSVPVNDEARHPDKQVAITFDFVAAVHDGAEAGATTTRAERDCAEAFGATLEEVD